LLLNAQADMEVVGEATDCRQAVCQARLLTPDIVTLDLALPGGGIAALEQIRRECPHTRILVLTGRDDPVCLRAALAAGGSGYLVKTATEEELYAAIRAVHRGRTFVNSQLTIGPVAGELPPPTGLSRREREVLDLVAHGYSNQEVASRLFLSVKTVETYRARIGDKLGLRTRAELVRYALEVGWLAPEAVSREHGFG
jgi:DNA-binding NarL/FixJ family response regulator